MYNDKNNNNNNLTLELQTHNFKVKRTAVQDQNCFLWNIFDMSKRKKVEDMRVLGGQKRERERQSCRRSPRIRELDHGRLCFFFYFLLYCCSFMIIEQQQKYRRDEHIRSPREIYHILHNYQQSAFCQGLFCY